MRAEELAEGGRSAAGRGEGFVGAGLVAGGTVVDVLAGRGFVGELSDLDGGGKDTWETRVEWVDEDGGLVTSGVSAG